MGLVQGERENAPCWPRTAEAKDRAAMERYMVDSLKGFIQVEKK